MVRRITIALFALALAAAPALRAQSTATILGTVKDSSGAVVPNAEVSIRQAGTNLERKTQTTGAGTYQFAALSVGTYRLEVQASGFQAVARENVTLNASDVLAIDFTLQVGKTTQTVTVEAGAPLLQTTTQTVGDTINQTTVQQLPLNGRHIEDLIQLVPGSVVPPANGFLTAPLRGQGSFGAITAGNREDTVNFQVNGINLQDMVQNQTTFQPSIATVSEFTLLNSTFSAEYGHTSGSVMNVVTRSGTNDLHGELFEFVRNEDLDAKNFFDRKDAPIPPFKRNNFGGDAGGPVWIPGVYDGRNKTFWFFSYEGLRNRQKVPFSRQVPTAAERLTVTDPTSQKLLPLIPLANTLNSKGVLNTFQGSGSAPVNLNQWSVDGSHDFSEKDRIHGYYVKQKDLRMEPSAPVSFATIPGFGDIRRGIRQLGTLNEFHNFSPNIVNELRIGFNRIQITFNNFNTDDPTSFGFTGQTPGALPEILIQNTLLDFGGGSGFPQGRSDTTYVAADTLSWLRGNHSFRFGGEFRRFFNNNFQNSVGRFAFTKFADFAAGKVNQFSLLQGGTTSAIGTGAVQLFAQDNYKVRSNLTLELGFRWETNTTPTERFNHLVAFDRKTGSLRRINTGNFDELYDRAQNFMPRIGFAWDPFGNGKTSVRAGYGIFFDQPVTNSVTGLATNPPFANPIVINSPPSFGNPFLGTPAGGGSLSPSTIAPDFRNSYVQNWNLNVQRELTPSLIMMVGYFGSKGTDLRLSRNANQPVGGVKPFPTITLLDGSVRNANIISEVASVGNSNYHALWVTAKKRFSRGLQFDASYTWSKSIDFTSLNTQGIVLQDSTNPRGNRGLSDFDARHHFVISYLYELPFRGNRFLVEGWAFSGATTAQSGNPINVTLSGVSPLTNLLGTVRPNLVGNPILPNPDPNSGFLNPAAFAAPAKPQFGNLGRNAFTGPTFNDSDISIIKTTRINERLKVEFRTEFFNTFNHPNFSQPNSSCDTSKTTTCGGSSFGKIFNTRNPPGDAGSSRQIQFGLKFLF